MRHAAIILSLAVVLAACGSGNHQATGGSTPDTAATGTAKLVLPFRSDDYAAALQEARQRNLPIFIETWAPW